MTELSLEALKVAAAEFAEIESRVNEPVLYGVTDGKAVGTYLERKFVLYLKGRFEFPIGNAALGIDIPSVNVDIKVTSIRQPQSSCPYRSARQKIYGLGYHLLVFVYEKTDDPVAASGRLDIQQAIFVEDTRTADYMMTRGLLALLDGDANVEELVGFMLERNLPVDEIEATAIAEELLVNRPRQGCLTISNALQWRLQYARALALAGTTDGVIRLR